MQRRSTVLGLMLNQKKITREQYDDAMATPLPPRPFRQRSGLSSIPFYVDRVLQEMARDYGIKDVKGRGLQIYTAIDLNAQDTAARTHRSGTRGAGEGEPAVCAVPVSRCRARSSTSTFRQARSAR